MRRTRCACSNVAPETKQFPNAYILDNKVPSETLRIISQTDRIRAQHDRGKRRKASKLPIFEQRPRKIAKHKK